MENPIVGERIAICKSCEHLRFKGVCGKCGCIMPVKVRFRWMKCPVGKWGAYKPEASPPGGAA